MNRGAQRRWESGLYMPNNKPTISGLRKSSKKSVIFHPVEKVREFNFTRKPVNSAVREFTLRRPSNSSVV